MTAGEARRAPFSSMADFAAHIACLNPIEAIALGRLNADLPDTVLLTTKAKLNGGDPAVIARTSAYIGYRKAEPALLLLDFDTKGMPEATRHRLMAMDEFAAASARSCPALAMQGRSFAARPAQACTAPTPESRWSAPTGCTSMC